LVRRLSGFDCRIHQRRIRRKVLELVVADGVLWVNPLCGHRVPTRVWWLPRYLLVMPMFPVSRYASLVTVLLLARVHLCVGFRLIASATSFSFRQLLTPTCLVANQGWWQRRCLRAAGLRHRGPRRSSRRAVPIRAYTDAPRLPANLLSFGPCRRGIRHPIYLGPCHRGIRRPVHVYRAGASVVGTMPPHLSSSIEDRAVATVIPPCIPFLSKL
jgi:hypothetical protein